MKTILSLLVILVAGVLFFTFTKPTYAKIQTVQAQINQYNLTLDKAQQLEQLKQSLLTKYNSFSPDDLSRLQTLLPPQVNNIGLILDLDTLANTYGMSLENVNITSPTGADGSAAPSTDASGSVGTQTAGGYGSLQVQFMIRGTYAQFEQYVTALQMSLRVVDLVQLSIGSSSSGSGGPSDVYTFSVTLQTYWLQ